MAMGETNAKKCGQVRYLVAWSIGRLKMAIRSSIFAKKWLKPLGLRGCMRGPVLSSPYITLARPRRESLLSSSMAGGAGRSARAEEEEGRIPAGKKWKVKGEFVPVYVELGLIVLSTSLGIYTANHQLKYAPNVRLRKSMRETVPELAYPDKVVDESVCFTNNSFFRKVAHVQDEPGATRRDVFAHHPRSLNLKSLGIEPAA